MGNFACVMTQAVLAKVVLGIPGGGVGIKMVINLQFSKFFAKINEAFNHWKMSSVIIYRESQGRRLERVK